MVIEVDQEILKSISDLLQKFNRTDQPVRADTDIMADLAVDSVAVLDVVMELEDRYDITVPMNVMPKLRTVGDLALAIQEISTETKK